MLEPREKNRRRVGCAPNLFLHGEHTRTQMNRAAPVDWTATFLVLMYAVSGANKVATLGVAEAERFATKAGVGMRAATRAVFLAGVWELVGAGLVLYGVWCQTGKEALRGVRAGTSMLAAFTVLATLIFYTRPFRYKPFLANMTALAGLLLLPKVCELRH